MRAGTGSISASAAAQCHELTDQEIRERTAALQRAGMLGVPDERADCGTMCDCSACENELAARENQCEPVAVLEAWLAMPGNTRRVLALELLPDFAQPWRATLGLGPGSVECHGTSLVGALADAAQVVAMDPSLGVEP